MQLIDLTHTFDAEMPVYPGDPEPEFTDIANLSADGFSDTEVTAGMHVGTHIDAPAHVIRSGKLLSDYPVERFIGRGVLADARGKSTIDAPILRGVNLQPGDIVLVLTGKSENYGDPKYYERFPVMTESFADALIDANVSMVAIDTPSPEAAPAEGEEPYPIHRQLLQADILIAENVNHLDQLANVGEFEVIALPTKFALNASPARIIARIA